MFSITVTERGKPPFKLEFDKSEVTIGRVRGNDIVLQKNNVSKRHSKIVLKDEKFIVIDLKSTNGTIVNGRKIAAPQAVGEEDKIVIGDFVLEITDEGPGTVDSKPSGGPPAPPPAPPAGIATLSAGSSRGSTEPGGPPAPPVVPLPSKGPPGPPGPPPAPAAPPPPSENRASKTVETPSIEDVRKSQSAPDIPALAPAPPAPAPPAPAPPAPTPATDRSIPTPVASAAVESTEVGQHTPAPSGAFGQAHRAVVERIFQDTKADSLPSAYPASDSDRKRFAAVADAQVEALAAEGAVSGDVDTKELAAAVLESLVGLGPVDTLLDDKSVVAIHVHGANAVFITRADGFAERSEFGFGSSVALHLAAKRLASIGGGAPEFALRPGITVSLASGGAGPVFDVRRAPGAPGSLEGLISSKSLDNGIADALLSALAAGVGVVVTARSRGDAAAFAGALVGGVAEEGRVIVASDSPLTGAVRSAALVSQAKGQIGFAMGSDPDVVVVEPLTASSLSEVLHAANGAPAVVGTLAARSETDAAARLEWMALQAGAGAGAARVAAGAFELLVTLDRSPNGTVFVADVSELQADDEELKLKTVFEARASETAIVFKAKGHAPAFTSRLKRAGGESDDKIYKK